MRLTFNQYWFITAKIPSWQGEKVSGRWSSWCPTKFFSRLCPDTLRGSGGSSGGHWGWGGCGPGGYRWRGQPHLPSTSSVQDPALRPPAEWAHLPQAAPGGQEDLQILQSVRVCLISSDQQIAILRQNKGKCSTDLFQIRAYRGQAKEVAYLLDH